MMKATSETDYGVLDTPQIISLLFHPRREVGLFRGEEGIQEVQIPAEDFRGCNFNPINDTGISGYGFFINIAARLEGLSEPGGICISKTAFDHIES